MLLKNNPLFSIIVPAYNVERYISGCIESVIGQSFQDYELILVNDGSTDQTGKICDQYAKDLPQTSIISQNTEKVNRENIRPVVKVIHQANAGLSAARNTGVAQARGEYLVFLDGDDYLEPVALSTIQKHLEPNLDLLRYQAQEVFADGKIVPYKEAGFATIPGVEAFAKLAHYHYTENAWLYAYRREFFVQNDFKYAEGCIAEDFGLTPLIIAKAASVKAIPDIYYDYRQRAGSIMHDAEQRARRVKDIEYQLKQVLPQVAAISDAQPIAHFLAVSFLTEAAQLNWTDFLRAYQSAKHNGLLRYVHPASLKALPRSLSLKYCPKLFYRLYHR